MRKPAVASALLLGAALGFQLSPAAAQSVAEFYKDKQIKIIVGNAAGGDYDIGGRSWRANRQSHPGQSRGGRTEYAGRLHRQGHQFPL